jgi:hypothetical protein
MRARVRVRKHANTNTNTNVSAAAHRRSPGNAHASCVVLMRTWAQLWTHAPAGPRASRRAHTHRPRSPTYTSAQRRADTHAPHARATCPVHAHHTNIVDVPCARMHIVDVCAHICVRIWICRRIRQGAFTHKCVSTHQRIARKQLRMHGCGYANTQMRDDSQSRRCKYTNMQICKYANMRIWEYAEAQTSTGRCKYETMSS